MLWRKKTKCPITLADKEWIQYWLNWIDKNVVKLETQPTILPNQDFFNWTFNENEEDARFILKKVGEYFNIDTSNIELNFYNEQLIQSDKAMLSQVEKGSGTAGLFIKEGNKYKILIEINQLKRPHSLISTIAHELCHYTLIGLKDFRLEDIENEWLTDLLAIAYGFGIFIGNSRFEFNQWQSGDGWGGWQYSIKGYFPQQITAFAMAEIEIQRRNDIPNWIKYLKKDFQNDFKKSMKYLISEMK